MFLGQVVISASCKFILSLMLDVNISRSVFQLDVEIPGSARSAYKFSECLVGVDIKRFSLDQKFFSSATC